jgi:hypothetical protein
MGDLIVIMAICVDSLIITSNEAYIIREVKTDLWTTFNMTDLSLLHYCLCVEFSQADNCVLVSQTRYDKSLLEIFCMADCKKHLHVWNLGSNYQPTLTQNRLVTQSIDSW